MAKEVMKGRGYVAASIGPLGKLFEPSGELTFEKAYEVFAEQVKAVADGGADIINFETFTDLNELTAALLAARDTANLPVICSMAFEQNGRTLMGNSPETAVHVLKSRGAAMVGTNCSMGPGHLVEVVKKMHYAGGGYLCVKPNAGLPKIENGEVVYTETPEKFALLVSEFVKYGARLIGGCCGTSPEDMKALKCSLDKIEIPEIEEGISDMLVSSTKTLDINGICKEDIGHIDALADEELASCLEKGDMSIIEDMVLDMAAEGYRAIKIDVDSVKKDKMLLANIVRAAQGYTREPLIIKTGDVEALEEALKIYCGRAGILKPGLECGEDKRIEEVANKYGAVILNGVNDIIF